MFFRLLLESFLRQRRRKLLAGIAILLGTTTVTAMLALATTIGDRIHRELAVYGANIVIYPKADQLEVKVGGVDIKPVTGGAYLKESDLPKLKGIFWGNNITGLSPSLPLQVNVALAQQPTGKQMEISATGLWFDHGYGGLKTGAAQLHPWWKIAGAWPKDDSQVVMGRTLASEMGIHVGDVLLVRALAQPTTPPRQVTLSGIVSTGDATENQLLLPLPTAQRMMGLSDAFSRADVAATTKAEDAFARVDPDSLSPRQKEIWYCRPYANSIAYQIREALPGAAAEQVRRVEQSEGTVLSRISGLMWLISAAALLAAGFAVSAAMATAVLERRVEIGLMRSLGASRSAIALLFYAETALLAIFAGSIGYVIGSGLASWLGTRIFAGQAGAHEQVLIPVLLPVVVSTALAVAIAGSTPSIRAALRMDPSAVLRTDG